MNTRNDFGQKITIARKQKGISQSELAERTGILPNNLSRIETGKYSTGIDILLKIADALDMELGFIDKALH